MKSSTNNILSNLVNVGSGSNENSLSAYDYIYDNIENNNTSYSAAGPQHLATFLQQLFSKMSDNKTTYETQSHFPSSSIFPTSLFSYETLLPSSISNTNSYHLLSFISLWFVLIINPIVVKSFISPSENFSCFLFHLRFYSV
jgi:hypothetical protein